MPIIILEGPDGVGKTSIALGLVAKYNEFADVDKMAVYLQSPGSTRLGELLRGPLKDKSFQLSLLQIALLMLVCDEENKREAERLSAEGKMVIMDRCGISSLCYREASGDRLGLEIAEMVLCPGEAWRPKDAVIYFLLAEIDTIKSRIGNRTAATADRFDALVTKVVPIYERVAHEVLSNRPKNRSTIIYTDIAFVGMLVDYIYTLEQKAQS